MAEQTKQEQELNAIKSFLEANGIQMDLPAEPKPVTDKKVEIDAAELDKLRQQLQTLKGDFKPKDEKISQLEKANNDLADKLKAFTDNPVIKALSELNNPATPQQATPFAGLNLEADTSQAVSKLHSLLTQQSQNAQSTQEQMWQLQFEQILPNWNTELNREEFQKVLHQPISEWSDKTLAMELKQARENNDLTTGARLLRHITGLAKPEAASGGPAAIPGQGSQQGGEPEQPMKKIPFSEYSRLQDRALEADRAGNDPEAVKTLQDLDYKIQEMGGFSVGIDFDK